MVIRTSEQAFETVIENVMDDPDFARNLLDALFERYLKRLGANGEA